MSHLDLLVAGSFITMTSATSPNWEKYSLTFSGVVCQERPPMNILPGSLGISSRLIGVRAENRPAIIFNETSVKVKVLKLYQ